MLRSYTVTIITYSAALMAAVVTCNYLTDINQWLMLLSGHLVATLSVFIASQIFNNSSLYDPFWSVAPIPIVIYLAIYPESGQINLEKTLLIVLPVLFWAFRLTLNWLRDWKGLSDEDFRYVDLKKKPFSILIDLFGIHIYPTLQVNLSLLPLYYGLSISTNTANVYLYLASIFTISAVVLETVADEQMRTFRSNNSNIGKTMKDGLWTRSRHPNYLGEILFWWGIFFMTISIEPDFWYLFVCPLIMNLMFSLITCKMMDNRSLERRDDYTEYLRNTRQLIPWKK
jgi:steroid 5-alpha reductase family enzyme